MKLLVLFIYCFSFGEFKTLNYKGAEVVADELLVKFKWDLGKSAVADFMSKNALSNLEPVGFNNWYKAKINQNMEKCLAQISMDPLVEYVEPNYILRAFGEIPNDTYFHLQYYLNTIKFLPSRELFVHAATEIIVAVVDTGIDWNHEDLPKEKLIAGKNFVDPATAKQGDVSDDNGHGTSVTGIICAVQNNARGITGINPKSRILVIKSLNRKGEGTAVSVSSGILHAVESGARVINLSLGENYQEGVPNILKAAISSATARGCIVVAASGNEGLPELAYPARLRDVIAVGATTRNNTRASFSQYGTNLDFVAPGVEIMTTSMNNRYSYSDGTSLAAPMVSAVISLLLSIKPDLTQEKIENILRATAYDTHIQGWDAETGWGIVDAYLAILHLIKSMREESFSLVKVYASPNPLIRTQTRYITFSIPAEVSGSNLRIKIFNFAGEEINEINEPIWHGKDTNGNFVPTGLYFYTVKTDRGFYTGRLTVIDE